MHVWTKKILWQTLGFLKLSLQRYEPMRSQDKLFASDDPLPRAMLNPAVYPHPVSQLDLIETHISWVILTGEYAYKIKKPVKLPFANFSTLSRRLFFCKEELRLNWRFAPQLYLDVVPIAGTRVAPRLGKRPAIEYAVKLRQFPQSARLDRQLASGALDTSDARALAEMIASFQEALADYRVHPQFGSAASVTGIVLDNLCELGAQLPRPSADLGRVSAWTRQTVRELVSTLQERKKAGFVREGHGDLHLENLTRLDEGLIVPFDALEFDAAMRWIDTIDEVAFLAMDFMARRRRDMAWVLLDRYLECTDDYDGLDVLPFYLVYRALVRAKVCALRDQGTGDTATRYLALASRLTDPAPPLLILTHGLSGSGKTTVSEPLVASLGAIRIRSDLVRKRGHDLAANADSGSAVNAGLYDKESSDRTYLALEEIAGRALRAGFNVIVDATFLQKSRRDKFRDLATRTGARRVILDCRAPLPTLRARIARRARNASDASEADLAVLTEQIAHYDPLCWDEQSSQILIEDPAATHVAALTKQILRIGNVPREQAG